MIALSSRMTGDVFCDSNGLFTFAARWRTCRRIQVPSLWGRRHLQERWIIWNDSRVLQSCKAAACLNLSLFPYLSLNNDIDELNVCGMLYPICSRRWEQVPVCLRVTVRHDVPEIVMIFTIKSFRCLSVQNQALIQEITAKLQFEMCPLEISKSRLAVWLFHVTLSSIKGN
jgi:hypothetical protein